MRHATVWAIQCLSNHQDTSFPSNIQACDWTKSTLTGDVRAFGEESADDLKMGLEPEDPLPTCPACALFVDLACIEAGLTGGENVEATVSS